MLQGNGRAVTVSAAMLKPGDYQCPMRDAMWARRLYPIGDRPPSEVLEAFGNAFFMDELDRREAARSGRSYTPPRRGAAHEGVRAWTEHALAQYDAAFPQTDDELRLVAPPSPWRLDWPRERPDGRGIMHYSLTLWGVCLQSEDGTYREFRWPSNHLDRPAERGRSQQAIAVAACIAAWSPPQPQPRRVQIFEFGLADGRPDFEPLFDGTPQDARNLYEAHGRDALTAMVEGRTYNPGKACTSCRYTAICPEVSRADGVLGVQAPKRPPRHWSPTTARSYRECPAREYLRSSKLPADTTIERSPEAERGRAVHQFLAQRHVTEPYEPCSLLVPDDWAGGRPLTDKERAVGFELIRLHAEVCPMKYVAAPEDVRVEPQLVFRDAEAASLVLVEPDLLYRDSGSWVWREVKTSKRRLRFRDLFTRYPQLAVGVELLARGALGGTPSRSRVEVEVLRPGGADLMVLDPFSPEIRGLAREALREVATAWRADDLFVADPGPQCSSCEMARWCPSRQVGEGQEGGSDDFGE